MPNVWGQNFPWNPAAPPSPGEAAWSQAWQAPLVHQKGLPWSGQSNESYRWFEPDIRKSYETTENGGAGPAVAYRGFLDYGFGDRQRPLLSYAQNYYGTAYAAAMAGEEGADAAATGQVAPAPVNSWTDALTPDLVYMIRQSFNMQTPGAKGYAIQWMPQGRSVG